MKTLISPLFVLVLWALVYCADHAIGAAQSRAVVSAICYGAVAVLALLSLILSFGLFQ